MNTTISQNKAPLILIVDDDPFVRMQLRLLLEREGYRIVEAQDGKAALAAFEQQPDIVLLDALMPETNGFECCAELQSLPNGQTTPILMITGLNDQESVDRAYEVGAVDYVTKPIHWAVLRQRVRRLIEQTQLQRELEAANRDLQRMASMDGLTQIANRRRFDEYIAQEQGRIRRMQLCTGGRSSVYLSLILCDIDHFKLYNDTYGHPAGDRCLQQVAQLISSVVHRSGDLAARYGGEEFVILMPETDGNGAATVAKRICERVRSLAIPHESSQKGHITISAGVATIEASIEAEMVNLVTLADQALYQAKQEGRDRFCTIVGNGL
ncbi:diguanylate cyclase response regulator [filamentous cyanobacterium CCP1]|nr:diguanylate cyclase response regulator [filamentous cyanobacterium CCP2]PSB68528.1 diguanylate cyclase response regulator [filamentous cyanobacterium CCP1]